MILTKQAQQQIVEKYLETHTAKECKAFADGMDAMVDLINKVTEDTEKV